MSYLFLIIVIAVVAVVLGIAAFTNLELDNWHYERLKWVVMRWSFLVTFIGVIVKTFQIPYGIETTTIVAALGALMAGILGISTTNYYADAVQSSFNGESLPEMMGEPEDFEEYETEVDEDETEDEPAEE